MEIAMSSERGKKGLISTTWERCKSFGRGSAAPSGGIKRLLGRKSKSWHVMDEEEEKRRPRGRKGRVAPEGCFSVYVGGERERFVIRTECANHPLFRRLLEEAEEEYGYNSREPLWLPCDVEMFYRVMAEMDEGCDERRGCGYPKRFGVGSYHLLSPSRSLAISHLHY